MAFDRKKHARDRERKNRLSPEWVTWKNAYTKACIVEKRKYLKAYKAERGCLVCSESDPVVLEFDHRDPADKLFSISIGCGSNFGWQKLLTEVAKCDVLCANCHRRRTAKQNGWT